MLKIAAIVKLRYKKEPLIIKKVERNKERLGEEVKIHGKRENGYRKWEGDSWD